MRLVVCREILLMKMQIRRTNFFYDGHDVDYVILQKIYQQQFFLLLFPTNTTTSTCITYSRSFFLLSKLPAGSIVVDDDNQLVSYCSLMCENFPT